MSDTKTGQHTENPSEDVSDCGSVRVKLKRKDGEGTDTTAEKVNKKGQNLSCSVLFEHERRVVTEWHNCEGVEQIQDWNALEMDPKRLGQDDYQKHWNVGGKDVAEHVCCPVAHQTHPTHQLLVL